MVALLNRRSFSSTNVPSCLPPGLDSIQGPKQGAKESGAMRDRAIVLLLGGGMELL